MLTSRHKANARFDLGIGSATVNAAFAQRSRSWSGRQPVLAAASACGVARAEHHRLVTQVSQSPSGIVLDARRSRRPTQDGPQAACKSHGGGLPALLLEAQLVLFVLSPNSLFWPSIPGRVNAACSVGSKRSAWCPPPPPERDNTSPDCSTTPSLLR